MQLCGSEVIFVFGKDKRKEKNPHKAPLADGEAVRRLRMDPIRQALSEIGEILVVYLQLF